MIFVFALSLAALVCAQFTDEEQARQIGKASFDAFVDRLVAQMELHADDALVGAPIDADAPPLCSHSASDYQLEAMMEILVSIQRTVARGSAFFNNGQPEMCARLYWQAATQLMQVLSRLDERDAADFFVRTLNDVARLPSPTDAAWALRSALERFVAAVRASQAYAPLFAVDAPLGAQRLDAARAEPDAGCAYGLLVQQVGNELRVYETRASAECDDELEDADAIFFVDVVVDGDDGRERSHDHHRRHHDDNDDDDNNNNNNNNNNGKRVGAHHGAKHHGVKHHKSSTDADRRHARQLHDRWFPFFAVFLLVMLLVFVIAFRRRLAQHQRRLAQRQKQQQQQQQQQQRVFGVVAQSSQPPAYSNATVLNAPYFNV